MYGSNVKCVACSPIAFGKSRPQHDQPPRPSFPPSLVFSSVPVHSPMTETTFSTRLRLLFRTAGASSTIPTPARRPKSATRPELRNPTTPESTTLRELLSVCGNSLCALHQLVTATNISCLFLYAFDCHRSSIAVSTDTFQRLAVNITLR